MEKGYVSRLMHTTTTACINIKRFLFARTLLPHISERITGFFLCGSKEKEISSPSVTLSFDEWIKER